eukprot:SAG31_NODE_2211_length_6179_cov_2.919572_7_plen_60_part_00
MKLMWPRLEAWQAWFLASQHAEAGGESDSIAYQWRGRDAGEAQSFCRLSGLLEFRSGRV